MMDFLKYFCGLCRINVTVIRQKYGIIKKDLLLQILSAC